jgi:hypothetical protein
MCEKSAVGFQQLTRTHYYPLLLLLLLLLLCVWPAAV